MRPSSFRAFLFDMDGTLLTSIEAAERVWGAWARRHGIDPAVLLPTIHGVRVEETIARQQLPGIDIAREARAITDAELDDMHGVHAIEGAAAFLRSLPADAWAVVTSAPRLLAERRMQAAGLPLPAVMVTAEDVRVGKPSPEGYLSAAAQLGVEACDCLVFEDAPAGMQAGEAAGATVIVVMATHATGAPHQGLHITGYTGVQLHADAGRYRLSWPDGSAG
ncbi:HAD-IA family hydrolase [Stenotrophomonas sp. 24(2023)]|uniref:HAD-IA family hydrolase n=1 Tax=Stenotrophomonas sp. 24(2023) TaxID=3068324 RepID=UPI0027DEF560|nr:HAD-IA family hydrolase [Stenotrophomonas sp. 24(2023)]WMJ68394.1 HAD-IA family hydrolase [Stenotrophomonas sp. 24(2023)]